MDIRDAALQDLRAVVAVATLGHFGRAARSLRVAQPTLSARVQKVERALDATLFERSARRFLVTPDGERLLPFVRELLAAAERLHDEAATPAANGPARPISLGIIPTLGPYLMPHLLLPLRREAAPHLEITERQTAGLVEAVQAGSLDVALLSIPVRADSLECIGVFDEPFRLIAPRASEIARVDRLVPSRLRACDMVLLEDGHCLREQSVAACNKRGGTAPRLVAASLETLKYLVAAGSGYSLLPALASGMPKELSSLITLRDFDEHAPSRRIGLAFRRTWTRRHDAVVLAEFIRSHPPPGVRVVRA